jgi:hypothetical protein
MLFEVIKAPDGVSPQWVRDAWVGVQFRALQGAPISMPAMSAVSGKEVTARRGYSTNARDLLGLLALKNVEAARWYIANASQMLNKDQLFLFDETCCKAIAKLS